MEGGDEIVAKAREFEDFHFVLTDTNVHIELGEWQSAEREIETPLQLRRTVEIQLEEMRRRMEARAKGSKRGIRSNEGGGTLPER